MPLTPTLTRAAPGRSKSFDFLAALIAHDASMPLGAALVLTYLYQNRDNVFEVSHRRLREALGMTSVAVSRHIYYWPPDLVDVSIDPSDRRGRLLKLTPAGIAFAEKLETTLAESS